MSFHKKLKQLRTGRGLSQEAVARAIDLSTSAIVKLESGRSDPAWKTVQRLAKLFDVPVDSFVNGEGQVAKAPASGRQRKK